MERLPTATRVYVDAVRHGEDPPARDATPAHAGRTLPAPVSVSLLTVHQPWAGTWQDRRRGRLVGRIPTTRPDHA